MNAFLYFLFPAQTTSKGMSATLLMARIIFGGLFLSHGIGKLMYYETLATNFPDPLEIGSSISLLCAIFVEVVCSLCIIAGLFYRLMLLPMIFIMLVAIFAIHSNDTFAEKELAIIYLAIFWFMLLAGAGRFSVDAIIRKRIIRYYAQGWL